MAELEEVLCLASSVLRVRRPEGCAAGDFDADGASVRFLHDVAHHLFSYFGISHIFIGHIFMPSLPSHLQ